MSVAPDISPLTLNRLSVYLRCLRTLEDEGVENVSSSALAERFELSSAQIRKDLAHFGEFGVRGVGYQVAALASHLHGLLGLDVSHRMLVIGIGNLGSALCSYIGFNDATFRVVAGLDSNPAKVGDQIGSIRVRPLEELEEIVREQRIDIGVLTIPADAAIACYERLVAAGVSSILNFAAVQLPRRTGVRVKNVEFRVFLEELSFFRAGAASPNGSQM